MDKEMAVERLAGFGLTRQEAVLYVCLLQEPKLTGYEAAKQTGISRSNAYAALANLLEKGAAYCEEEEAVKKYIPVALQEFCSNYISKMERDKEWLENNVLVKKAAQEGYITIEGSKHILNKMRNLLQQVEERVYVSSSKNNLSDVEPELKNLIEAGKKVVIITDEQVFMDMAKVYVGGCRQSQIGIIADSKYVLTGEYGPEGNNTCLYSGQQNFVELYKNALANEIRLIEYQKGKPQL